ncbi:ferritin family protein [Vallitalea pronyensis]|uniref:Ferritin family protein n=1 Tax=Vallitalea pronyensis TaxID=1348613 RepID=A0A8J8SFQ4_9FIRM|nr:ferritin family protein [Vallitalea pronyensis]QUI21582.1 ferritin family protein [Vallitalea pronyensis]
MEKIKKILQFAMNMERQGQVFYGFYSEQVKDEHIKKLFSDLEKVEKEHYYVLKETYDDLLGGKTLQDISWVVDDNSKVKSPDIFTANLDTFTLDQNLSDITVLRMAYLIEHDFAEFYKKAADSIDEPSVKAFLSSMAAWEEEHRDFFYDKYQNLKLHKWDELVNFILE